MGTSKQLRSPRWGFSHLIAAAGLSGSISTVSAQPCGSAGWDAFPPTPVQRRSRCLVYDAAHGCSVLFGGTDGDDTLLGDTWEWRTASGAPVWVQKFPAAAPSLLSSPVAAYHEALGVVVVFGISYAAAGGPQTWVYDSGGGPQGTWTRLATAGSPTAWLDEGMVYDGSRQTMVLFGGEAVYRLNETWELRIDGTTGVWSRRSPANPPGARTRFGIAYDPGRRRTVVYSGQGGSTLADTWEYDGNDGPEGRWELREQNGAPGPRSFCAMTYDASRSAVVLLGGFSPTFPLHPGETWAWDGSGSWSQLSASAAQGWRGQFQMTFDADRGRVLIFGGFGSLPGMPGWPANGGLLSDTWELDPPPAIAPLWRRRCPSAGPPADNSPSMSYDAARDRLVVVTKGDTLQTWEWNPAGSTESAWELRLAGMSEPPVADDLVLGFDRALRRTMLVTQAYPGFLQMWNWNGEQWAARPSAVHPSRRVGFAGAFDASRRRFVVFGGETLPYVLSDETWEWDPDGGAWVQALPVVSPAARRDLSMTYDEQRRRVVLFGGHGDNTLLHDLWEWDGDSWTLRDASAPPPARYRATLTYDAQRGKSVLFGGASATSYLNDVWEWNGAAPGRGVWTLRPSASAPMRRVGPAAAYDSTRGRVMVFGGEMPGGGSDTLLSWRAADPPVIAAQPSGVQVADGEPARLTVTALGSGDVIYQWFRDSSALNDDGRVQGSGTPALSINPTVMADRGLYSVVLTNACGPVASNGVPVWIGCGANCDSSTTPPVLNVNDISCFLNAFASGDQSANCDGSTTPPALNVNDFVCFLNAFARGCP